MKSNPVASRKSNPRKNNPTMSKLNDLNSNGCIIHLFTPPIQSAFNIGVVYKVLMLIVGFFALIIPSPICAWISLTFCLLSILNQPLPFSWRYTISNIPFPIMLIFLSYNINPHNNPVHQWLGWTQG